jgi:DNA-binding beta-propeller fold protein YncE
MKNTWLIPVIILLFGACVKDKPNHPVQPQIQLSSAKKVYIINEGPYQNNGNGAVSLYDPGTKEVIGNFYEVQNQSQIGNVLQSINYINGNYYLVVNNANKIVVCDNQFRKKAQINGLTSPRYILNITNEKAYVSDLYANAISVVDLNANLKTGSIPCYGKTERMVLLYNKVFVTNSDKAYVYVINTLNDQVSDSIFVGKGAASLVIDRHDRVWVLAGGEISKPAGKLSRINPLTNQVELSFDFPSGEKPDNLCLNRTKDTLYFLNNHIYRMAISSGALPSTAFVEKGTKNFYGLGLNPNDYTIYASDALDYLQNSQVYIYTPAGIESSSFKAGLISNGFYFE